MNRQLRGYRCLSASSTRWEGVAAMRCRARLGPVLFLGFVLAVLGCQPVPKTSPSTTPTTSPVNPTDTPPPPQPSPGTSPGAGKEALPPCPADDMDCRIKRIEGEGLGWLKQGLASSEVTQKLGEPEKKGEIWEEGASGEWVQEWEYPKEGIFLTMSAATQSGPQSLRGVRVKAPFSLKTPRGVGIGSSKEDVQRLYADSLDPDSGGEQLIAGSIYGGIFFSLEGGRVSEIYIGAGAE